MYRIASGRLSLFPFLIVIASALLPLSSAQEAGSQVQEHFLAAQRDQQEGLLNEAVHEYQAVLRLQPQLPEAYVNLGLIYYAQAKFDDSAHALQSAGKLRPGMRGVSLWLGIDYVRLNRPTQGAALLWPAYEQLGRAYAMEKNYVRAEEMLRRALAHDPDGSTHFQLGQVLRAEGKPAEAAQAFATVRAIKNEKMASPSSSDSSGLGAKQ